jgi:hypothetical protein
MVSFLVKIQQYNDIENDLNDWKEEEIDIDLTDPEVEKAATKIQAGFRGHKTRQDMKGKTEVHVYISQFPHP